MAKKLGPPIFLGVFTVLAIVFLTGGATDDKDPLRENFQLEAIYYDTVMVMLKFLILINLIKLLQLYLKYLEWKIHFKNLLRILNL